MTERDILERDINRALDSIVRASIQELTAQGYVNTGRGIASFETRIVLTGATVLEGQIWGEQYLVYLDTGTKPHFPPVAEIFKWVVQRGLGDTMAESESISWAIATAISIHGTPLPGSYEFSKNGRRTEWSKFAALEAEGTVTKIFEGSDWVDFMLKNVIPIDQAA